MSLTESIVELRATSPPLPPACQKQKHAVLIYPPSPPPRPIITIISCSVARAQIKPPRAAVEWRRGSYLSVHSDSPPSVIFTMQRPFEHGPF